MSSWSPHKSISSISNFPNQTLSNNITGIYPLFGSKSDNDLVNIPWTTNILSSGLVRCSRILSFGRPGWTVGVPWMDDLWKIPGKVDDWGGPYRKPPLLGGWSTLWKIMECVSWDDDIPNWMEKQMFQTTNQSIYGP